MGAGARPSSASTALTRESAPPSGNVAPPLLPPPLLPSIPPPAPASPWEATPRSADPSAGSPVGPEPQPAARIRHGIRIRHCLPAGPPVVIDLATPAVTFLIATARLARGAVIRRPAW